MLFVIRTGNTVGTHQRAAIDFHADHYELAIDEAQGRIARGPETEQAVIPVMNGENGFGDKRTHDCCTWKSEGGILCRQLIDKMWYFCYLLSV